MNKKFMLHLSESRHKELKVNAMLEGQTLNNYIINCTDKAEMLKDAIDLLMVCENYISGGPCQELSEMIRDFIESTTTEVDLIGK